MDVKSINTPSQFINLVTSIGRNPSSWRGWSSLLITLQDMDENLQQECLFWSKSVVEASLSDFEGRVYFRENEAIHIICKNIPWDVLSQTGQHICALIRSESSVRTDCLIYDLYREGDAYMEAAFNTKGDEVFSVDALGSLRRPKPEAEKLSFGLHTQDKLILNHRDYTKVLLVEDDPVTRWMVRSALKHECQFATSSSANKAFGMYASFQPDVVFLDINLPDKSGYEVLEWIMRHDPGACVVMFSSEDHLDNIANALEDGASGFIAKPFLKENLLHYIHNHRAH